MTAQRYNIIFITYLVILIPFSFLTLLGGAEEKVTFMSIYINMYIVAIAVIPTVLRERLQNNVLYWPVCLVKLSNVNILYIEDRGGVMRSRRDNRQYQTDLIVTTTRRSPVSVSDGVPGQPW